MVRSVLILACGSFNPPTIMHLRLFELAKDHLRTKKINVIGGIISPVHDKYGKKGLLPSNHRINMVKLAIKDNDFVKCSQWEVLQEQWTRTRAVLDEYKRQVAQAIENPDSKPDWLPKFPELNGEIPQILLVCGGDLLESFSVPGLWKGEDIQTIVKEFGLVVVSREGSNPEKYVYDHDVLYKFRDNIHIVVERVPNDISSTRIRKAIRRKESIRYFVPDPVIQYISENKLYQEENELNEYIEDACVTESIDPNTDPECMIVPSFGDEPLSKNVPENGDHEIALTSHHTNTSNSDNNCMGTLETFDIIDPVRDLALLNVDDSSSVVHDDDEILNHDVIKDSCKKVDSFDAGSATATNNISNVNIECSNVETFETIVQLDHTSVTVEDGPGSTIQKKTDHDSNIEDHDEEDEEEDCSCTTTGSNSNCPTPVHFEITPKGVKVISDKESFL